MLTLSIDINPETFKYYSEVLKWIRAQQQNHHVKLLFKVKVDAYKTYNKDLNNKDLIEFLNSIYIIELEIKN